MSSVLNLFTMKNLLFPLFIICSLTGHGKKPNVLLVTGCHGFDTVQFFNMFDTFKDIRYKSVWQPEANRLIATGEAAKYDILVFYDMWESISEPEKQGYIDLTKQ